MTNKVAALVISAFVVSGIGAPIAEAAPCRAIPAPGCTPVAPDNPMEPRKGPRSVDQGKKNVNDGKTPAIRF